MRGWTDGVSVQRRRPNNEETNKRSKNVQQSAFYGPRPRPRPSPPAQSPQQPPWPTGCPLRVRAANLLKCIRTEKGARIVHYPLRAPSDLLPSLPPSFLASCPLSPSLWAVKQYKGNPRHDSAAYCDPPASAPIGQCDMHCGTVNARNDGVERGPCSFSARFYKVHVLRSVDLWVRMSVKSRAFCCATARVSPLSV